MGFKHTSPDGWWPWRSWVNKWLQQLHTDVQRLLRQTGVPPVPGVAPPGPTPWNPLNGGGAGPYEQFITGTLATPLASGGSALLNITVWNGSAWVASGQQVTIYDRFGLTATLDVGTLIGATWHAQSARYIGTNRLCT